MALAVTSGRAGGSYGGWPTPLRCADRSLPAVPAGSITDRVGGIQRGTQQHNHKTSLTAGAEQ